MLFKSFHLLPKKVFPIEFEEFVIIRAATPDFNEAKSKIILSKGSADIIL